MTFRSYIMGISIALVLLLASCSDQESRIQKGGAHLFVQDLEHDFGTVFSGAVKNATFVLENRGNSDLVIFRAQKDCGCTKPSFSQKTLAPGESGTMTVTLIAPDFHGTMSKRIRVYTNDPNKEITVFRLTMNGMGKANISPTSVEVDSSPFQPPAGLVFPLTLELPPGQAILAVHAHADSPFVKAAIREGQGTSLAKIDLRIEGLREERLFRDYVLLDVTVRSRSGKKIVVQPQGIQVKGRIGPQTSLQPSLIDLGHINSGSLQTIELAIVGREDAKIQSVTVHNDGVLKSVTSKSKNLNVHETYSVELESGRLFASAQVLLTNGIVLEVPILAWVERQN